jgi:hypothetical protein
MMPLWHKIQFFQGCSSLSALTYNSLDDVQKFITLRPFIVSESVNTCWKLSNFSTFVMFKLKSDTGRKDSKTGNLC